MKKTYLALGAATLAIGGCFSGGNTTPNEFRIVTKAPLEVPPDYNLRPPRAGSSIPAEVANANTDRAISFGQELGTTASQAERELVTRAGALAVNPAIRGLVDYEESGVLRKPASVTDEVLAFEGGAVADNATGGGEVVIESRGDARIKLPGT